MCTKPQKNYEEFAAREAMKWYGWGSPIGLGLFLLIGVGFGLGTLAVLIRIAIYGCCFK
ncbi:MAG: hypothetical protein RLZ12_116 [Bacillota bacterium]